MSHPLPDGVDLEACLFGGQAFTWWSADDTIEGLTRGTRVSIDPVRGTWTSTPDRDEGFLAAYLGRERTRPRALAEDPDLGALARRMPGLRLLDQDPWEGTLAFMISPANNVPRIQATIAKLCRRLGDPVDGTAAVPGPQAVADAERPIEAAHDRLVELDGVGPKVAECILCYALGFDRAFPVDRWVARAGEHLLGEEPTTEAARQRWGDDAAMAQQVVFHGARKGYVDGIEASPVAGFDAWRSVEV
ncbi:hypothetical protein BRD56_11820 [Thermoplasmatales archaeon SW_10_69_26]|nr:MAG: hypothetical protein BRD56_11820 [Thermoplasmatales archaeon SW_10_69_26]